MLAFGHLPWHNERDDAAGLGVAGIGDVAVPARVTHDPRSRIQRNSARAMVPRNPAT